MLTEVLSSFLVSNPKKLHSSLSGEIMSASALSEATKVHQIVGGKLLNIIITGKIKE